MRTNVANVVVIDDPTDCSLRQNPRAFAVTDGVARIVGTVIDLPWPIFHFAEFLPEMHDRNRRRWLRPRVMRHCRVYPMLPNRRLSTPVLSRSSSSWRAAPAPQPFRSGSRWRLSQASSWRPAQSRRARPCCGPIASLGRQPPFWFHTAGPG